MIFVIFPLAVLGFISGISAYTRIGSLVTRVSQLEEEIAKIRKE